MIPIRRLLRGIGIIFLVFAALLFLLTVGSWPPEGLFFGLPFFFLIPALLLGIVGGLLWLCSRPPRSLPPTQGKDISK
jgi:hypothetical protein